MRRSLPLLGSRSEADEGKEVAASEPDSLSLALEWKKSDDDAKEDVVETEAFEWTCGGGGGAMVGTCAATAGGSGNAFSVESWMELPAGESGYARCTDEAEGVVGVVGDAGASRELGIS